MQSVVVVVAHTSNCYMHVIWGGGYVPHMTRTSHVTCKEYQSFPLFLLLWYSPLVVVSYVWQANHFCLVYNLNWVLLLWYSLLVVVSYVWQANHSRRPIISNRSNQTKPSSDCKPNKTQFRLNNHAKCRRQRGAPPAPTTLNKQSKTCCFPPGFVILSCSLSLSVPPRCWSLEIYCNSKLEIVFIMLGKQNQNSNWTSCLNGSTCRACDKSTKGRVFWELLEPRPFLRYT
jgi:hypothetical protein